VCRLLAARVPAGEGDGRVHAGQALPGLTLSMPCPRVAPAGEREGERVKGAGLETAWFCLAHVTSHLALDATEVYLHAPLRLQNLFPFALEFAFMYPDTRSEREKELAHRERAAEKEKEKEKQRLEQAAQRTQRTFQRSSRPGDPGVSADTSYDDAAFSLSRGSQMTLTRSDTRAPGDGQGAGGSGHVRKTRGILAPGESLALHNIDLDKLPLLQFRLRGFVASDFWAVCELARDAALEPDALQTDPDPGSLHAPTAGGSAAPAQEKGVVYNTVRRVLSRLPLRDRGGKEPGHGGAEGITCLVEAEVFGGVVGLTPFGARDQKVADLLLAQPRGNVALRLFFRVLGRQQLRPPALVRPRETRGKRWAGARPVSRRAPGTGLARAASLGRVL